MEAIRNVCTRPSRDVAYPTKGSAGAGCNGERSLKISEFFGSSVYGVKELKASLPKPIFANLIRQMEGNQVLDRATADAVAHSVKVWAMARGATHYTHWFQPLTNSTAEKHDSFLTLDYSSEGGRLSVVALDSFSGSQLMQAEPDASSFPSGGIRSTFEARGYTVWDTTSPMFLQEGPHGTTTLYVPSIFISYTGDALDEKTILLRSCTSLSAAAVDLLRLLGDEQTKRVHITLGTEQEFFFVDRALYAMRPDLKMTGRTLLGAAPAKHQQLEDHYFGQIPSKVLAAISEAELELWKLGVPVKTRHNEVAPRQFEMAPVFEEASIAVDHNLLTMHVLHKVGHRHGLKCLFHEKPFAGVNGSGKHCNWSMSTDTGMNLLEPGAKPEENYPFLVVLAAILLGLKRHSGLLSASIASAANEHRLGANEAPPSIISAFLGAQLNEVLDAIEANRPVRTGYVTKKGVNVGDKTIDVKIAHLPAISRDATDRNRTSPFAFTGNKFEFRAVGSSQSPSFPVTMLNAATAAALQDVIAMIKERKGAKSVPSTEDIIDVVRAVVRETKGIRFEGNGYSEEWVVEAKSRGLPNLPTCPDALKQLLTVENHKMLVDKIGIMNESELQSRFNILCEKYTKDLLIEANTLKSICRQNLLPSVFKFRKDLAAGISVIGQVTSVTSTKACAKEREILERMNSTSDGLYDTLDQVDKAIAETGGSGHGGEEDAEKVSQYASRHLKPLIMAMRRHADKLEEDLADEYYPMPKYSEILFS